MAQRPFLILIGAAALFTFLTGKRDARADFKTVGVNLSSVNYYSTELPFKDLMRQADAWRVGSTSIPADHAQIDPAGWVKQVNPGQYFSTYLLWDLNYLGNNPNGYAYLGNSQLVLKYEGEGSFSFGGGYNVVSHDILNKRIVFAPAGGVAPTQGLEIKVTSVNPANYLRNIRVTKPQFEADPLSDPWDPTFLAHWQDMRALRFMDWGQTNSSPLAAWSDRTPVGYFSEQGRNKLGPSPFVGDSLHATGVRYETMIELCNRLDKDLWLCVPHKADDAYVTQLATLVSQTLEPGRQVYVEHSNEVWNNIFQQYPDAVSSAHALIAAGQTQLNGGGDYGDALRYHGLRTKQIGQIFDGILGSSRVVTVLGTQQVNTWVTEQAIGRNPGTNTYWDASIKDVVDAVAVADYMNISDGLAPTSVDQIFTDLFAKGLPAARAFNYAQRQLINHVNPNIELIAYEGGQHLGYGAADPTLFIAANRDPRMGDVYERLLNDWNAIGGELFMAFDSTRSYSQYGSWGLLEAQGQDPATAPKYQAVLDAAHEAPADFDSDGDVDAADLEQWLSDFSLMIEDLEIPGIVINSGSDADGDNDGDGADLLAWQRSLGDGSPAAPAAVGAPEPSSAIILSIAVGLLASASTRREDGRRA